MKTELNQAFSFVYGVLAKRRYTRRELELFLVASLNRWINTDILMTRYIPGFG